MSAEPWLAGDSNWGRWGDDDQRGAVNLVGPEKTMEAGRLIRTGRTVSLSRPIPTRPGPANPEPAVHAMRRSGASSKGGAALDYLAIAWHGYACTHLDALCHVWGPDGMWNGHRAVEELSFGGATWGGIEHWGNGIVTRGVLLDVPRFRGEPFVDSGNPVTGEELSAITARAGVEVGRGDAVAVFSGRGAWDDRHPASECWGSSSPSPGLAPSCLEFIRERDCSVVLWDMMDVTLSDPDHPWGVHAGIFKYGLALVDNVRLEPLAAACAEEARDDFLLTIAPLVIEGGTGSPVNPIAVF